jgi:hypothetical protein
MWSKEAEKKEEKTKGEELSIWVWCPLDTCLMKVKHGEKVSRKESQNSAGPNKCVVICLKEGCTCPEMEGRVMEILQAGLEEMLER